MEKNAVTIMILTVFRGVMGHIQHDTENMPNEHSSVCGCSIISL